MLTGVDQMIKGMEELLLGPLLLGQEMDVIDDEDVRESISISEEFDLIAPDRRDELVDKSLAGDVADFGVRPALQDLMANGLKKVSLSKAYGAMDEKRVVGYSWLFGDSFGSGKRKGVGRTLDEIVKG